MMSSFSRCAPVSLECQEVSGNVGLSSQKSLWRVQWKQFVCPSTQQLTGALLCQITANSIKSDSMNSSLFRSMLHNSVQLQHQYVVTYHYVFAASMTAKYYCGLDGSEDSGYQLRRSHFMTTTFKEDSGDRS